MLVFLVNDGLEELDLDESATHHGGEAPRLLHGRRWKRLYPFGNGDLALIVVLKKRGRMSPHEHGAFLRRGVC